MRYPFTFTMTIAILITAVGTSAPAQGLSDPQEILERYFRAVGGLERLQAETTSYSQGTLSLAGMEGTVKLWTRKPALSRVEITLGPLSIVQADNGKSTWVLDQNGKLQVITNFDEATLKRRQVRELMAEYAFAAKSSDTFAVRFEGVKQVDGKDCYVLKITNNINVDSYIYYLNINTFILEQTTFLEDVESRDIFYADYREVEGLKVPFWTKEISRQTGQAQETRITRYISNLEIDPSMFDPRKQVAKDYHFITGDRVEDIPFEFIGKHIYIPVNVGGKERLWILDTGAGMTVLNKAFADELGLGMQGGLKGVGAGGTVTAAFTTLPSFSIKGIQFKDQKVAVIDMDELIRRLGPEIVGILGYDFLSRFVTKVDFARERLSFYEPETFSYTGEGHVLDINIKNSIINVPATLDGTHSGSWLFDLGAGVTHLDGRYALREGYSRRNGILRMGHGAGNEYQLKCIKCDSLQFAGYIVYQPELDFAYGGTDTAFTSDQIGVLGNSLFRNFVIYCDYARERLIVEKGDKFNHSWPVDNSGLQLAWSHDRQVEVSYVSPCTPAEKVGFKKGDVLRSVNGIRIDLLNGLLAVRRLLEADPGTEYQFVVERMGKKHELTLKLRKIL